MPLPRGTPEEVLIAAATPAPEDVTGTAAQLFPKTKHVQIKAKAHAAKKAAKEPHHRVFHLPDHDMHAVVSIEQKAPDGADTYVVLHAECWEVDAQGKETGLHAPVTTHSIPHRHLDGSAEGAAILQDAVDLITANAVERLAKRKKALAAVVEHPLIKNLPPEDLLKKPELARATNDPTI